MDSTSQSLHAGIEADRVQQYAPYGKACLHCAKSKTRCAAASVGGKCERYIFAIPFESFRILYFCSNLTVH